MQNQNITYQKKKQKFYFSSLPEEIQEDIFLKLPVDSIGTCRCVCKVWRSRLTRPKFIKTHLKHTLDPRFAIHKKDSWKSMIYSADEGCLIASAASEASAKVVSLRMDFPFLSSYYKEIICDMQIIGSCNGFVCFSIWYSELRCEIKHEVCLWNPSTGEHKDIPRLFDYKSVIGFAYDNNVGDYKVVIISFSLQKIEVHGLRSDSWTEIRRPVSYMFSSRKRSSGFLFNGALHWPGFSMNLNRVIIYFNINNNQLLDFPLPDLDFPPGEFKNEESEAIYDNLDASVGVLGDRLCLAVNVGKSRSDIWVMQEYGVKDTWTKLFSTLIYCCFTRQSLHLDDDDDDYILMDTRVGLVLFGKKKERRRDVQVNFESVKALLLWDA